MSSLKIRLGGVPEHFNLPIHLAIEQNKFLDRGLDVEWITYAGGTGQMNKALREGEADLCILLTEGITSDIIKGNPSKIISLYVNTPLTWGIHTGAANSLENYNDIFDKKYAISRYGSGSHLMAIVDANSKQKALKEDQFVLIRDIKGALKSLTKLESDVFYWEKFTTKPYVDDGLLKRIGEYHTPWPCFVIAARNDVLEKHPAEIIRLLRIIHDSTDQFMYNEDMVPLISERYKLKQSDAERWFNNTEWAVHGWVSNKMLRSVVYNLKLAGIIDEHAVIPDLVWKRP